MEVRESYSDLQKEIESLQAKLDEANETLHAIKTGQVDAIVVADGSTHQLYSLKSADHTYRIFIEKMKEGAVTLNRNEVILYGNSQFASMVGLPLEKVIGIHFIDYVSEESRSEFKRLISKGWNSDSRGEICLQNNKGDEIPVLLSFTTLELDEGTALSIILSDVSAQKKSESELKLKNELLEQAKLDAAKMNEELEFKVLERTRDLTLSREHFKFLADNIPVMIWTTDPDGKVDYFNKQWYDYTGLDFQESKTSLKDLMPGEDFERSLEAWRNAVVDKRKFEYEFRFKRASDDEYRWHRTHAVPFRDIDGNVVAWFGTTIDIEDQKKELEKKDEFISVASHELKTPLTSLKGYMQLINVEHEQLPERVKNYVRKASDSLNKLHHLINDLLDVSKIHAGKLKFGTGIIELGSIIFSCVENSEHIFPSHKIRTDIDPDLFVKGNAERLEQVIMNLINNAVKYSPSHDLIDITAKITDGSVKVSVRDYGIGLSLDHKKKIFERFFRVNEQQFLSQGLGMGLYISAEIIKEHEGFIEVDSVPKNGSTFSFILPLFKKE